MFKKIALATLAAICVSIVTPALASDYVGNAKTHKFHYSDCRWAKKISSSNIVYFNSRDEAVGSGYVPCKVCKP